MARKHGQSGRGSPARSEAQQRWNAALGAASKFWDCLNEPERLNWNLEGQTRRTTGQRYCVKLNARRFFNGQEPLRRAPAPSRSVPRWELQQFVITNRRGRLRFMLKISQAENEQFTIWASRPCNRGRSFCDKCPRLGPVPALRNGLSEFTELYFQKHGPAIAKLGLGLVGKRIFIRLRQETDEGPSLALPANAVVPAPDGWRRPKSKP